jgi:hypothetical protein
MFLFKLTTVYPITAGARTLNYDCRSDCVPLPAGFPLPSDYWCSRIEAPVASDIELPVLAERTTMIFASTLEVFERLAIPIGIGLGVLLTLLIPAFRRNFTDSYKKGKQMRERLTGKDSQEDQGDSN